MVLEQLKTQLKTAAIKFDSSLLAIDIDGLHQKRAALAKEQEHPDLYNDIKKAQKITTEYARICEYLDNIAALKIEIKNLDELLEIIDDELMDELKQSINVLEKNVEKLHLATLLKGDYDGYNAIVSVHAGAGGTESCDWAGMLYRMYKMYCDKNGFNHEEFERINGDEAGIKNVTFIVKGTNAYGFLKAEKGVHRLVRISPFDSNSRRHTSFASIEVMPEIENEGEIKIAGEELKIDTFRSGGAGGQSVNKTESAIRITHIPSGIVVSCQNERSQLLNKESAMKMLMSKLAERRERELAEKAAGIKGEMKKIEWGSQIRNYVFQPYTMVKDLRTGHEDTDVDKVMNGGIDEFILEFLRKS
ncbi:MAG: peptide chain release factor 2 [Firmicutes bacterium]|nr:peptide chain release factor 2 [Bacillota bacterium]